MSAVLEQSHPTIGGYTGAARALIESKLELHGLELRHYFREEWLIILRDASYDGKYRRQHYSRVGLLQHATYDSLHEVFVSAIENGFVIPDKGSLNKIFDASMHKA